MDGAGAGRALRSPGPKSVVAIDVGGTKVAAALVDSAGHLFDRRQVPTDPRGGAFVVQQVIALARDLMTPGAPAAIGIAVPAVVDESQQSVVWAPNIPAWRDTPLAERVTAELGLPAVLEQDGLASVVGEHWVGAARGTQNVVMVIIGTGIGGGMVLDGRLYRGSDGLAGCAAWLSRGNPEPVYLQGERFGSLDAIASGPSIARRGGAAAAEEVFAAAAAGDVRAEKVIDEAAEGIGLAVADIVSLLNPELVVLGGGVGSGGGQQLLPRIRTLVQALAQPVSARRVRIALSELGANASLLGAARQAFLGVPTNVIGRTDPWRTW